MSMRDDNLEATINGAGQIRKVISDATVGWANESAKRQVRALVFSIRCKATDPYIREKAANIESWTDILFSTRKWRRYGSAECVQRYLLSDCAQMASRAETLLGGTDQEV